MRIVYIGIFHLPNGNAAASRVMNNAKALRKAGHTVTFIGLRGNYYSEHLCEDGVYRVNEFEYVIKNELFLAWNSTNKIVSASNNSTRIVLVSNYTKRIVSAIRRIDYLHTFLYLMCNNAKRILSALSRGKKTMAILKELRDVDVIIAYDPDFWIIRKLIKYCSINGVKLVCDITEWYDYKELHFLDRLPCHINMTQMQHKVKNKIVISSYLDKSYFDSHNIIIPPLCDITDMKWDKTIVDDRLKPFEGITFIYAGFPGSKKDDVHIVIDVVNRLMNEGYNIRLLYLGTTRERYLNNYGNLLEYGKQLNDNILFLGRVSQNDVPAYYKLADFMILLRKPTRKNMAGFATKLAESISAGVPVITNNTSDICKYIQDGVSGFIVPGYDHDSLYSLLKHRVLSLPRNQIVSFKERIDKNVFHYEKYIDPISAFMNTLK